MQIDIGAVVSVIVGLITIYTFIRTNAKNQDEMDSKIKIVQNDIKHLSDRVERHNGVVERTYKLEQSVAVMEEEIKVEQHRMSDVENILKEKR